MKLLKFLWYCIKCALDMFSLDSDLLSKMTINDILFGSVTIIIFVGLCICLKFFKKNSFIDKKYNLKYAYGFILL